ncbi:hypothetical protein [Cupriavidus oxalaticus]|uniref:hypothetical protein n=1 Tax=Cupriavidus oxalaticus TaxID=96344 RepID=UPI0040348175
MGNLQSPGHMKLKQKCIEIATELGLMDFSASWAEDIINKEGILTITAATGTDGVRFSEQEVQEYDQGFGVDPANTKIRNALQKITD